MPYKNGVPCICEICICGRHHCPCRKKTKVSASYGPDTKTEYEINYVPHAIDRPLPCVPKSLLATDKVPFSTTSTNKHDYVKHPLEEITRHRPDDYIPNTAPLDGTTMYSKDYVPKDIAMRKPFKQVSRVEPAPFRGESTNKADYRPWDIEVKKNREKDPWKPPTEPFEDGTLYGLQYKPHKLNPPHPFRPSVNIQNTDTPFDGLTGYRQNYVKHPLSLQPPKKRDIWAKPKAPLDGLTTFKKDYTLKPITKLEPYTPKTTGLQSGEPMSSETTTRNDYLPWKNIIPVKFDRPDYIPPEGGFDFNTMYNKDFIPHPISTRAPAAIQARKSDSDVPFDGETLYNANFKDWKTKYPARAKTQTTWQTPTEPLDGCTIYNSEYLPRRIEVAKPFKNEPSLASSDAPMIGTTTYKDEYIEKSIVCPAALLDTPSAKHIYKETDESTGHKFYEPLYVTVRDGKSNTYTNVPVIKNNSGEYSFTLPGSSTKNVVVAEA